MKKRQPRRPRKAKRRRIYQPIGATAAKKLDVDDQIGIIEQAVEAGRVEHMITVAVERVDPKTVKVHLGTHGTEIAEAREFLKIALGGIADVIGAEDEPPKLDPLTGALAKVPLGHGWLLGRGWLKPTEPAYGFKICALHNPDITLGLGEAGDPVGAIEAALADYRSKQN